MDTVTGKGVADATVNFQAKSSSYTTQTSTSGNCRIEMPASDVVGVQYPAATVTKTGYEPQTIICPALSGGSTCNQDVYLVPLATNISIPVGGDTVMHLGDGAYEGANNSQFQKPTDGTELSFAIADWAEQVKKPGVTKAIVYLDAKGWQSDVCRNEIAIVGDAGTQSMPGGVSPTQGYWAGGRQVPFEFDVAQIGLLQAALKITSGPCRGTVDLDDFEINRIRVEFV
ncbi:MAG: hypothetical protein KF720_21485 [Rubrivivax sp.]|nr:hypothetical protein [Rubrivivax sp.]